MTERRHGDRGVQRFPSSWRWTSFLLSIIPRPHHLSLSTAAAAEMRKKRVYVLNWFPFLYSAIILPTASSGRVSLPLVISLIKSFRMRMVSLRGEDVFNGVPEVKMPLKAAQDYPSEPLRTYLV